MNENTAPHFVETMTWDRIAGRIDVGACAILPIGAGAKQHGFHLPMNTDRVQAEWLAAALARRLDALIWPTVSYGHYPAFVNYAGSCSLTASTFEAVVQEIVAALVGFGCSAVFVLDTGVSTRAPVERALARLGHPGVLHLRIHAGPGYRSAARMLSEQGHGSHADELETSIMIALAPHLVDIRRAEASPARVKEADGPLTPIDIASPNYSRSGSFGDPTLANREKGEVLLAAMTGDLIDQATAFVANLAAPNAASNQQQRGVFR